jgi:hypothetical protein
MNRANKIHSLKVIKESTGAPIIYIEKKNGVDEYFTSNGLKISEQIRKVFFRDAIIFENVSKQFKR